MITKGPRNTLGLPSFPTNPKPSIQTKDYAVDRETQLLAGKLQSLSRQYHQERKVRRELQQKLIETDGFSENSISQAFMPIQTIRSKGAVGTILVCGSMRGGDNHNTLEFSGVLSGCKYEQVFIKDFYKTWYQHGLMGVTKDRRETITFLQSFLDEFPRPMTVVGASSGGYAALLFGHALEAERIVTFGAQTKITNAVVKAYGDKGSSALKCSRSAQETDLRKVYLAKPYCGNAELHFAARNNLDARQHAYFSGLPNVMLKPHKFKTHNVAVRLRTQGILRGQIIPNDGNAANNASQENR
jgi:hypothetical protein